MMKEEMNKESVRLHIGNRLVVAKGEAGEDWGFGLADVNDYRGGIRSYCRAQETVFNFPG